MVRAILVAIAMSLVFALPGQAASEGADRYRAEVPGEQVALLADGPAYYRDTGGTGPSVVLLHPNNSVLWASQVDALSGRGYRVIAVDFAQLDGGKAGIGAPIRRQRLADLLALIEPRPFHLVAHGGGAVIATQFALLQPGRLRSLTISNSAAGLRDEEFNTMEKRLRSPLFDAMPREWRELGPSFRAVEPVGVARWLDLSDNNPRRAASPIAGQAPEAPVGVVREAPELKPVTWERLDALTIPLQIISGDADLYTPPSLLRHFASRSGARGDVIPDAGHAAYWENPERYNEVLLDFLEDLNGR